MIETRIRIWCDGFACLNCFPADEDVNAYKISPSQLRDQARLAGWHRRSEQSIQDDVCPDCMRKRIKELAGEVMKQQ